MANEALSICATLPLLLAAIMAEEWFSAPSCSGGDSQPKVFRLERLKSTLAASLTLAAALGNFVAARPAAVGPNDRRTPIADAIGGIGEHRDFDQGFREPRAGA
jgi:hypothetical protein